ncbi:Alpha beta hydrolase fold protein [Pleurostoma richardsiae]|uniref:Alpha beta hydrolase fold protein n=1 Tax=Pleurostoma richardsiae TaxID=41990 RepID=A0AA38S7B7_9PEZI|nr:Alpha beta hydrolase fold protein [Pleurostoma richardsiae]
MSSYFTTPSGTKIHFLQSGNPSGQLLICLHGLGGSTETFTPLLPLLPQSFNVVRVDFPGFGKTPLPAPPARVSVEGHVADLHHLITSLQAAALPAAPAAAAAGPVVLVGHSLGAIVALQYAARSPEGVAGLLLLGAGRAAGHIPAARQRMLDLAAGVREKGIRFAADTSAKSNFYEDAPGRSVSPEAREAVREAVAASDPEGYAQTCEAVVDLAHVDPDYAKIKCPAVFVAGDKDVISPLSRSQDLAALVGGEGVVEVVKSGHQPILEDLEGVKRALDTLLGKI